MKFTAKVRHDVLYSEVKLLLDGEQVCLTTCHRDDVREAARDLKRWYLHLPKPKENTDGD